MDALLLSYLPIVIVIGVALFIGAALLVAPWDPSWHRNDTALRRAGAARLLATGVDSAAALSACRAAWIGAITGRAAARLLAA